MLSQRYLHESDGIAPDRPYKWEFDDTIMPTTPHEEVTKMKSLCTWSLAVQPLGAFNRPFSNLMSVCSRGRPARLWVWLQEWNSNPTSFPIGFLNWPPVMYY